MARGRGGGEIFGLRRDEESGAEEGALVEGGWRGVAFSVVDFVGFGVLCGAVRRAEDFRDGVSPIGRRN